MLFKTIRNRRWKEGIQGLFVFSSFSILFCSYYFYNLFLALKDPAYLETARRMGLIDTHWPGGFLQYFSHCLRVILTIFARKIIINKTKLYFIYLVFGNRIYY